jgi:hypothetical protein
MLSRRFREDGHRKRRVASESKEEPAVAGEAGRPNAALSKRQEEQVVVDFVVALPILAASPMPSRLGWKSSYVRTWNVNPGDAPVDAVHTFTRSPTNNQCVFGGPYGEPAGYSSIRHAPCSNELVVDMSHTLRLAPRRLSIASSSVEPTLLGESS